MKLVALFLEVTHSSDEAQGAQVSSNIDPIYIHPVLDQQEIRYVYTYVQAVSTTLVPDIYTYLVPGNWYAQ